MARPPGTLADMLVELFDGLFDGATSINSI